MAVRSVHVCVGRAVREYSLPELCDGGCEVGDVGCQPKGLVLADRVLHTELCVPGLLAFCPGELRLKAMKQVVETPGQDHNVVDVQERYDDNRGVANTWGETEDGVPHQRYINRAFQFLLL